MSEQTVIEAVEQMRDEAWTRFIKARGAGPQGVWQGRYDALCEVAALLATPPTTDRPADGRDGGPR